MTTECRGDVRNAKRILFTGPQKYAVYVAEMIFDVMKAGKAVSSDLVHLPF